MEAHDCREGADCRICLEAPPRDTLVAPCECSGSCGWVHRECLERWVVERGSLRCEVCRAPYDDAALTEPARQRIADLERLRLEWPQHEETGFDDPSHFLAPPIFHLTATRRILFLLSALSMCLFFFVVASSEDAPVLASGSLLTDQDTHRYMHDLGLLLPAASSLSAPAPAPALGPAPDAADGDAATSWAASLPRARLPPPSPPFARASDAWFTSDGWQPLVAAMGGGDADADGDADGGGGGVADMPAAAPADYLLPLSRVPPSAPPLLPAVALLAASAADGDYQLGHPLSHGSEPSGSEPSGSEALSSPLLRPTAEPDAGSAALSRGPVAPALPTRDALAPSDAEADEAFARWMRDEGCEEASWSETLDAAARRDDASRCQRAQLLLLHLRRQRAIAREAATEEAAGEAMGRLARAFVLLCMLRIILAQQQRRRMLIERTAGVAWVRAATRDRPLPPV